MVALTMAVTNLLSKCQHCRKSAKVINYFIGKCQMLDSLQSYTTAAEDATAKNTGK